MKNPTDGPNGRKKPGEISKLPSMIALKELIAELPPDRQDAALDYLEQQSDDKVAG